MIYTILLAALPALVLVCYIYLRDKYEREPLKMIAKMFGFGILSAFAVLLLHQIVDLTVCYYWVENVYAQSVCCAFIGAAIPEELFKFAFVYFVVWRNINYNQRVDGIVYAVCVSMGFAFVENVVYFIDADDVIALAVTRSVYSVPGHFLFAVVMGYFLSLAKFVPERRELYMTLAIVCPIIVHGLYNSILMLEGSVINFTNDQRTAMLLNTLFIVFNFFLWQFGLRNIRKHIANESKTLS